MERKHESMITYERKKNTTKVKLDALEHNMNKAKENID